jgi:hypothetical protein
VEVVTGNGTGIVAHLGATLDETTTIDPRGEIETCSMTEEVVVVVVEDEVEEGAIGSEAETVMNSQPNKDEAARRVQPRLLRRRSLRQI